MELLQRSRKIFKSFCNMEVFEMTKLRADGPNRKTKDATVYLFRGFTIIGFLPPETYLPLFIIWTIFMNGLGSVCTPLGFLLSLWTRKKDFSSGEFLASLQVTVNCFGCTIKLTVFLFLYKRLMTATKYMDRLDLRITTDKDQQKIRKVVAFCNRLHIMFLSLYFSYAIFTFLTAVLNGKPPYQLYNPIMEWTHRPLYFYIQATVEYLMIDIHCYQQAVLDSYPVIYIAILRAHLHILTRRISTLGQDSTLNSDERYEDLVQCILDHKNIMLLYNEFAPVLSGTMFVQFLIIGIILGITTIHIVLFADIFAIISSMIFATSILAETFPCSYLANCLMDDNDSIALAIFHSDWPNQDVRYQRAIAYFLQNTQKTLILTAMKIFPITMNSNINVAKFAFSVYTLIKQMDFGLNIKGAGEK